MGSGAVERAQGGNLMQVMDKINQEMGRGSMTIAASGFGHGWTMLRERKSHNYATDWNELPVVG